MTQRAVTWRRGLVAMVSALVAACAASDPDHAGGGDQSAGGSTHGDGPIDAEVDAYAAELGRGVNVRCGECWEQLGHPSEKACRDEAQHDVLGDAQRTCFDALAATDPDSAAAYLQCRTSEARWYNDCFAQDCDLLRCAMAYGSRTRSAACATGDDDAGAGASSGATSCDPTTDDQ